MAAKQITRKVVSTSTDEIPIRLANVGLSTRGWSEIFRAISPDVSYPIKATYRLLFADGGSKNVSKKEYVKAKETGEYTSVQEVYSKKSRFSRRFRDVVYYIFCIAMYLVMAYGIYKMIELFAQIPR